MSLTIAATCLALNMYFEIREPNTRAMLSTALVVRNRMLNSRWPNEVCTVIKQNVQFSWYWDGKPDRPFKNEKEIYQKAELYSSAFLGSDIKDWTDRATHYHAHTVKPNWNWDELEETYRDEYHIFYRYKGE